MRRLLLIAVLGLAACGSSHTTTSTHAVRTVTLSRGQEQTQDAQVAKACGQLNAAADARCAQLTKGGVNYVIECGTGLSTNGDCVFADHVASAFQDATYGSQQDAVTYGDEVDLTVTGTRVRCLLARPGVRRCQSRTSQVWVQLPNP